MVGRVVFDAQSNAWAIECEPHVSLKLKRVFRRLNSYSFGTHRIAHTPEVARDLEWFLLRYPMEIDDSSHRVLTGASQQHVDQQSFVHRLLDGYENPRKFELAIPPREYQEVAATAVLSTKGLLLADEVGVGKTAVGICLMAEPSALPMLVVTLTHLPLQWQAEIARFAPDLRVHILRQGTPYDFSRYRGVKIPAPDVIVTSYSKLAGWSEHLAKYVKSVVFDEAQELRRTDSQRYRAAQHIAGSVQYRLPMTATPIYNYGDEFHAVMNIASPDCLGTREEFLREWCTLEFKPKIKDPRAFGSYLRDAGLMIRRTRKDVGRELPPLTKIRHVVEADTDALNKVSRSCAELARLILREGPAQRGEKMRASEELSNTLRQATGVAKAPYVADFVRLLCESEEKVLLYGWHRLVYDIWRERLADLNPVFYTGTESPRQKEAAKQEFIAGRARVFICSLRAGAGLDGLQQVCRTVAFGELDWSPQVLHQNVGRVDRDGQRDPVTAYFLVSEHGADPIMAEVLGLKRMQSEPVLNPEAELVERLTTDDERVRKLARMYLMQLEAKR